MTLDQIHLIVRGLELQIQDITDLPPIEIEEEDEHEVEMCQDLIYRIEVEGLFSA